MTIGSLKGMKVVLKKGHFEKEGNLEERSKSYGRRKYWREKEKEILKKAVLVKEKKCWPKVEVSENDRSFYEKGSLD